MARDYGIAGRGRFDETKWPSHHYGVGELPFEGTL